MFNNQVPLKGLEILCVVTTGRGILLTLLLVTTILSLRIRYRQGLRNVPGPFLASIFPFDRLVTSASGRQQWRQIEYHEIYDPFVRVGPNHVSISQGEFITQIYRIGNAYPNVCSKCAWWSELTTPGRAILTLFRRNLP
jgi:hypothetical protein